MQELWTEVDNYYGELLAPTDATLDAVLLANEKAGLPAIGVSPLQGKLLEVLVRITSARRVLEIGTLGGYSTIWMARALPEDGRIVTLEFDPHHAEVAMANLQRAGVAERVDLRVGRAIDSLPKLAGTADAPFDLIFIDADKKSNPAYLEAALALTHPGSLIVIDNVVRGGRVLGDSDDPDVVGTRRVLEMHGSDPRLQATAVQTVSSKGWDGFAVAYVLG